MAREIGVGLLGLGSYLPQTVRRNDFWGSAFTARMDEKREKDVLTIDRSSRGDRIEIVPEIREAIAALGDDPFRGARERRIMDDDMEPSDMEAEAARQALAASGVRPEDINVVLTSSHVPDRLQPSNAPAVQAKCNLVNAVGWSLEVSCSSFQPHLVTATALIRGGMARYVLSAHSSALSRILDTSSILSTTFGDGAAAAVIGEVPAGYGLLGHRSRTDGSLREGVVYAAMVDGKPDGRWYRHVAPIRLTAVNPDMGKRAGQLSTAFCREVCLGALEDAGLTLADVDLFVANQSIGWLVDACRRGLGLPEEKMFQTFAQIGSIGSGTSVYNLQLAQKTGRLRDGDVVLLYLPGSGFTATGMVYRHYAPAAGPGDQAVQ